MDKTSRKTFQGRLYCHRFIRSYSARGGNETLQCTACQKSCFISCLPFCHGLWEKKLKKLIMLQGNSDHEFPSCFTARNAFRRIWEPFSVSTPGRASGQQTERRAASAAGGGMFSTCSDVTVLIFKCQETLHNRIAATFCKCILHGPSYQPLSPALFNGQVTCWRKSKTFLKANSIPKIKK